MASKLILCVDFDGVIHSYQKGWQGGAIYGTATVGFFRWLSEALVHFRVVIYSTRSKTPEGIEAMRTWLRTQWETQGGPCDPDDLMDIEFANEKPITFLTIDDRAIRFDGVWAALDPEMLLAFKPWYQRPVGTVVPADVPPEPDYG